ncbi:LEA14-like dessication related protein [Chitinivorax tropicus]|uniref:LEA14-like dessication related protein n=1 Tax=Chitinivorax tropicus TaxID=714531 RepID=A0A840MNH8_9PROT|nr:LEA type 2 family protein [Chitinivorax tropicus]MBB5020198.1 LEA14-like dessication related protein [Chitinivorax tropicus]
MQKPQPPQLSIAGISLVGGNLFEQQFILKLRVQNPNDFDLQLSGLHYKLELGGQEFVTGQSNQSVTVKRLGSDVLEVEAYIKLFELIKQAKAMAVNGKVPYRLTGEALVGESGWRLPFDRKGEYDLAPLERLKGFQMLPGS